MVLIATLHNKPLQIRIPKKTSQYILGVRCKKTISELVPNVGTYTKVLTGCIEECDLKEDSEIYSNFISHHSSKLPVQLLKTSKINYMTMNIDLDFETKWENTHMYKIVEYPIYKNTGIIFVDDVECSITKPNLPSILQCTVVDPIIKTHVIFNDTLSEMF